MRRAPVNAGDAARYQRRVQPETLQNGDVWYDSSAGLVKARAGGSTLTLIDSAAAPWTSTASATAQTTDATVTTCGTVTPADATVVLVEAAVVGRKSDGTAGAVYRLAAGFRRAGGTVTQIGVLTVVVAIEDNVLWDAVFDVSGTAIRVRVTGVAATTIDWKTRIAVNLAP